MTARDKYDKIPFSSKRYYNSNNRKGSLSKSKTQERGKSFTSKTRKGNVYHSHAGDISEHKLNTDYS